MATLAWDEAVDIGHGRGRLAAAPAASLRRVDSAFGRAADINEAWRSPVDADKNYERYLAFLRGGAWAPIALPGDKSVHCFGFAVDTDDTADWQIAIWNDHGWFWTVYRNGRLAERWHLEYFPSRDNHRSDPPTGQTAATPPEEEDMQAPIIVGRDRDKAVFAIPMAGKVWQFPDVETFERHRNTLVVLKSKGQPVVVPPALKDVVFVSQARLNDLILAQGAFS